jgi:hypothetical protein
MTEQQRLTLEERLAIVEAELKQAKDWRRRVARVFYLAVGCTAALFVVVSRTVPAIGGGPMARTIQPDMTVNAPFTVVSHGVKIFDVTEGNGGGVAHFYTLTGRPVVGIGAAPADEVGGYVSVYDPNVQFAAQLSSTLANGAGFTLHQGLSKLVLELGKNVHTKGPFLVLNNEKGPAVQLLVSDDTGKLILTDAALDNRVVAGTETNGDGTVQVSGPKQRCYPGFVGLPCMLVAH